MNRINKFDEFLNEANYNVKWPEDVLQSEVDKYETRNQFRQGNKPAYQSAQRRKLIDKLFKKHPNGGYTGDSMPSGYWTYDRVKFEADKYKTRTEFQENDDKAYQSAVKYGFLDELFKNRPNNGFSENRVQKGFYKKTLQDEVAKYKTRAEFQMANNNAYQGAIYNGMLDDLFKDKPNQGFSDDRKKTDHFTIEELKDEVTKYETRGDFQKGNKYAYQVAYYKGLLDELFKNHKNNGYSENKLKNGYSKKDKLQDEVNKYNTRIDFYNNNKKAYHYAVGRNLLDELFKNKPNQGYSDDKVHPGDWTKEKLQDEVNKYKTRREFEKNNDAYVAAYYHKLLDELFKNHENQGYQIRYKN